MSKSQVIAKTTATDWTMQNTTSVEARGIQWNLFTQLEDIDHAGYQDINMQDISIRFGRACSTFAGLHQASQHLEVKAGQIKNKLRLYNSM